MGLASSSMFGKISSSSGHSTDFQPSWIEPLKSVKDYWAQPPPGGHWRSRMKPTFTAWYAWYRHMIQYDFDVWYLAKRENNNVPLSQQNVKIAGSFFLGATSKMKHLRKQVITTYTTQDVSRPSRLGSAGARGAWAAALPAADAAPDLRGDLHCHLLARQLCTGWGGPLRMVRKSLESGNFTFWSS